ncbi:hypothetical protein CCR85_05695 [Rhodothalassium salexigens]|nr:hypothetical protein [Rhodothalassium salexigens]MBK5921237.1 hypothetical protein [Rhodothalassium salexigens]
MVVDDSAVIRGFLTRFLEEDPKVKVVASAANGEMAVRNIKRSGAEVVLLDIEMPQMDGMTALPKLLAEVPDLRIVMASTLTKHNAEITLRALRAGAVDYVPKPESNREVNANVDFRREIVEKVRAYASARRKDRGEPLPDEGRTPSSFRGRGPASFVRSVGRGPSPAAARPAARSGAMPAGVRSEVVDRSKPVELRGASRQRPTILAIGASTGGPQALIKLFDDFKIARTVPVLIVQHMPATFTSILADHLGRASGMPTREATQSGPNRVVAGEILVAPGNYHMVVRQDGTSVVAECNQAPPENFCRPAVDPMFRSVARVYGDRALGLVLTGMGHDGLRGARELVNAGGTLFAQDEASSVVWGMPGAVATAGLCHKVLPLAEMQTALSRFIERAPA